MAAIRVATLTFFHNLERKQFQSNLLNKKELTTLQKYINRYCCRPTPFGLFSALALTTWSNDLSKSIPGPVDLLLQLTAHIREIAAKVDRSTLRKIDHTLSNRTDSEDIVEMDSTIEKLILPILMLKQSMEG
jgi:hypothetical protein